MSSNPVFPVGKRIAGRWNKTEYAVERVLGEGANGKVYLVRRGQERLAMKVGSDTLDLQSEVNTLKILSGVEGSFRSFLVDVDDWEEQGRTVPFYVMRFVEGQQLQKYLSLKGGDWFPLIGLRLLEKLAELHRTGYLFGDLKKENVLVSGYGMVELVDFGGVTPLGKAVKQFTEIYDRCYWNAGDRTGDAAYDLFSFAVLCIHVCGGPKAAFSREILPQNRSVEELLEQAAADPGCAEYLPFLKKALRGGYAGSGEAVADWRRLVLRRRGAKPVSKPAKDTWIKVGFAASLLLFAATVWYYW
ncbi:protein kinase domain-containing protein [Paenibacillus sp. YN15]|uniref:protein kinase domain-containing protein n=1 Tax=Paenibacillus sp. YN15 TaxID=1742774 RepID=UPI00215CC690|nr:serine/threonine protein kinase [Paenibacillus sp. YN15]